MSKEMIEEQEEKNELESLEELMKLADEERNTDKQEESESEEQEEDEEETDSNDDDSVEQEDEEDSEKEDSETDNENEESNDNKETKFETLEFEVAGHKIKIDSKEELVKILQKGAESLSNVKEKTKEELALEQSKLSKDDIALFVDAMNGDKSALAKIAQLGKIDLLDVNEEDATTYSPKFTVNEVSEVEKVAQEIVNDKELHSNFTRLTAGLPKSFINAVTSNANDLRTFGEHVKNGLAQEIIPEALKLTYQGMSFEQAYVKVGTRIMTERNSSNSNNNNTEQQTKQRELSEREKDLRKKAKETSSSTNTKSSIATPDDIWNMSQEEFDKLIKNGEKR